MHCEAASKWETVPVTLGKPHTLLCTYNCSDGFRRGIWRSRGEDLACPSCHWTELAFNNSGDLCTQSLHTTQLMRNDTQLKYICVSCQTDHPGIPCRTERQLELKISTSVRGKILALAGYLITRTIFTVMEAIWKDFTFANQMFHHVCGIRKAVH